jgi:hypothetical protein
MTMNHQRNIEGLRENARKRHEETLARAETAIARLYQADETITFASVSRTAGVSLSWLYKQPRIRERIQYLREQQRKQRDAQLPPVSPSGTSDSSKDAIIAALKEQIKQLRAENRDLRKQLEVAYGQLRR